MGWGLCPGLWGLRCRGERLWDGRAVAEPSSGRTLCLGVGRPASGSAGLWGQGRASPTGDAAGGRMDTGEGTAPLFQKVLEQGRLGLGGHASGSHRAQWAVTVGTRSNSTRKAGGAGPVDGWVRAGMRRTTESGTPGFRPGQRKRRGPFTEGQLCRSSTEGLGPGSASGSVHGRHSSRGQGPQRDRGWGDGKLKYLLDVAYQCE